MADSQILSAAQQEGVLVLTLNHPPVNAFNRTLIDALQLALTQAARDQATRCVVLTGAGHVFSAGQDLTDFDPTPKAPYRHHLMQTYNPLILQIRRLRKPVLAAVNGPVSGAALGVVLACDLRIAANTANFRVGFSGIGLSLDSAVSVLLPALIGLGRAGEFAYSNAPIDASQAVAWGLVNRIAGAEKLLKEATDWAGELARGPLQAIGLAKRAFNRAVLPDLEAILDYEAHLQEVAGRSDDHKEGISAFIEKRPPKYR